MSTAQVIRIVPDSLPPFNVPDSLPLFNEDSISANTLQDIVSPGKRKRGHTKRTAVETAPDPGDDIDLPTLTEVDEPSLSDIQSMPCSPVIGKPDIPTEKASFKTLEEPPHIKALLDKLLSDDSIVPQVDDSITPIEPSSIEDRKDTDRKAKQILAFAFSSDEEMDDK